MYYPQSTQHYEEITGRRLKVFNEIMHVTTNFFDDNTSVVGANSSEDLEEHIQNYYYLLSSFYTGNKLKLNGNKTKLMMLSNHGNPISLMTNDNEVITCDNQAKILGWWSNPKNPWTPISRE